MFDVIPSILIKYWLEWLLGLVVAGFGFFIKRYISLSKKERDNTQKQQYESLKKDIMKENETMLKEVIQQSATEDAVIQKQVDDMKNELTAVKAGILSVQRKEFYAECRRLLRDNHQITLDEWEEVDADHEAYNGLGGNHKGDALFQMVKIKAESTLTTN